MKSIKKKCNSMPITKKNDFLEVVKQNGNELEYASEEFRNDKEIVLEAARQNGHSLKHASEELKKDKGLVLEIVKQYPWLVEHASEELRNDKEIVLAAVKLYGKAFEFASEELKNDKEVVLAAVKQNGMFLEYASEEMKNDIDVARVAMEQNYSSKEFVGNRVSSEIILQDPNIGRNDSRFCDTETNILEEERIIQKLKNELETKRIRFSDLKIGKLLGSGTYGRTYTCQPISNPEIELVLKIYKNVSMERKRKKDLIERDCVEIPYHRNVASILYHTKVNDLDETIDLKKLPDYENFWNFYEELLQNDEGKVLLKDTVMILMRYHRKTLSSFVAARENFYKPREVDVIMLRICNGVYHLNNNRIVHRDLHSDNIFVDPDFGRLWLGDFGCAIDLRENPNGFLVHKDDIVMFSMSTGGGTGSFRIGGIAEHIPPEIDPDKCEFLDYEKYDMFSCGMIGKKLVRRIRYTDRMGRMNILNKMTDSNPKNRFSYEKICLEFRKLTNTEVGSSKQNTHTPSSIMSSKNIRKKDLNGSSIINTDHLRPLTPELVAREFESEEDIFKRFHQRLEWEKEQGDTEIRKIIKQINKSLEYYQNNVNKNESYVVILEALKEIARQIISSSIEQLSKDYPTILDNLEKLNLRERQIVGKRPERLKSFVKDLKKDEEALPQIARKLSFTFSRVSRILNFCNTYLPQQEKSSVQGTFQGK